MMRAIPAGHFAMGSGRFYPEEQPVRERVVSSFEIDVSSVTNHAFAEFVEDAGYVTTAEQPVEGGPGPNPETIAPGSIVFVETPGPVDLRNWRNWWRWIPGASWRHPGGPDTTIEGLGKHPVVQVSFLDAVAFAEWAGKRLPTETEFEYVAGAGNETIYPWGDERDPEGRYMANTWRGRFPYDNTAADGWSGTSPVGSFPPNDFGLYDTIGNVWEWTSSFFTTGHLDDTAGSGMPTCCAPSNQDLAAASAEPGSEVPRRVIKGGSHLCAPEYCLRYRASARSPQAEDSATNHIGFRCVTGL